MAANSPTPDRRSLLAKGCSALARAGQMLSTVSDPAKGRQSLHQVAHLMEADRSLDAVLATAEIAHKCRTAAEATDDPQVLGVCRQIATGLARTASSLAKEIQQPSGAPPRAESRTEFKAEPAPTPPEPAPGRPTPATTLESKLPPHAPPTPPPVPTPVVPPPDTPVAPPPAALTPRPATTQPAPQVGVAPASEKPRIPAVPIDRVTIARTVAEKDAITRILQEGKRFAVIANGTLIDVRNNRMWTSRVTGADKHAAAQRMATDCRSGQYTDWRLPQPAELRDLLASGGREPLRSAGVFQPESGGSPAEFLWSAEVKSRFLGLFKQVTACQISTGSTVALKPAAPNLHVLLVRS